MLDLLAPAPMARVAREFPGLFGAALACLRGSDPHSSWAALACLHRLWEVLGGEVRAACYGGLLWGLCCGFCTAMPCLRCPGVR